MSFMKVLLKLFIGVLCCFKVLWWFVSYRSWNIHCLEVLKESRIIFVIGLYFSIINS